MAIKPIKFISESVEVYFEKPPLLEKVPGCPDGFTWREDYHAIVESISEWDDTRRRGRMAHNMRPTHTSTAERRGSWGVGQYYFRVRTTEGRIFDLYYDRAPKNADNRKGAWFLDRELAEDR